MGRHRHAVHGLVLTGGRSALLGHGLGLFTGDRGSDRRLLAAFESRGEVAGAGEHRTVERADVDAVVEQDPVPGPGEALDQIDPSVGAGRDARQVVEVLHPLVAPEPSNAAFAIGP